MFSLEKKSFCHETEISLPYIGVQRRKELQVCTGQNSDFMLQGEQAVTAVPRRGAHLTASCSLKATRPALSDTDMISNIGEFSGEKKSFEHGKFWQFQTDLYQSRADQT